ncbi:MULTISPECIES: hypothetical protein [Burkholderia]|uniref:MFS transporter n=1 Tax=Burkholderia paludis TaxID=1506587 RepID=A0A6J5DL92_9BURK|nr:MULTISPECIES: hypothetical protein [Burkholderia]CAB3754207.1 hypothetical protein LMG30113_02165 [Burkholderia paludis]VWB78124.1 hypothetical protein BPA30113_03567 [Burkholderia paludis]
MNIGGYLPAGLMPVMTGYAIDRVGFTAGATGFAVALTAIALAAGAAAVLALRHDND